MMDSAPAIEGERPLSGSLLTARVDRQFGVWRYTRAGQVRFLTAPSLVSSSVAREILLQPGWLVVSREINSMPGGTGFRVKALKQAGSIPAHGFPSGRVISSKILSLGLDRWG